MKEPLVSVITPSYNQGIFITETIESVINQTYKNIEYIIVDGASTDNTKEILDKYKDVENIKILIEKDNGQSDAINKGFKLAHGEIVGWINSDDILKQDCVENIVNMYNANKDAAIFYGDIDFIDENSNFIKTLKAIDITYNSLLNKNPDVFQPGSFYNREYVEKVGYLDDKIHFTMDYDLWLRLLKLGKAINLHKTLSGFRLQLNSKTMSSGNWKKFWGDIFNIRKTKHNTKFISRMHLYFLKWLFSVSIDKIKKAI